MQEDIRYSLVPKISQVTAWDWYFPELSIVIHSKNVN